MNDAQGFTISEPPRPVIQVVRGELDKLATAGEAAIKASSLPVFQRGNGLVRPISQEVPASHGRMTVAAGLRDVSLPAMIDLLSQAAAWQIWNGKKKELVACDPPALVASVLLSRAGQWSLPVVAGIITTPTLRPDGSILSEPGYDPVTRLYHVSDPELTLPLRSLGAPSREDAEAALKLLDGLLDNFPFVHGVDRSVALSGLITPVIRGALPVAPLHVFRASTAGTGKSFLADLASAITTGRLCPVAAAGQNDEETEKRLIGLILAGFPVISLDNVNGELGGDLLCQAIERQLVRVRPLGRSEIIEIESRATLYATGNNIRVTGDMTRRTLVCSLDAGMERPETRTFPFDPVQRVLLDRGRYVLACLTIARAYLHAKKTSPLTPVASFGAWSDLVRSPLVWLGRADPAASMEAAREDDPELGELREMLVLWRQHLTLGEGMTTREIVDQATHRQTDDAGHAGEFRAPDFRDALLRIAGERGAVNTKRLAHWFLAHEGRVVTIVTDDNRLERLRLKRAGTAMGGLVRWCAEALR